MTDQTVEVANRAQLADSAEIALNKLDVLRAKLEAMTLGKQDRIAAIITPEIQAQLDAIEAEYTEMAAETVERIAGAEASVKSLVLALGESVKAVHLQAVYTKPRVTWDTKSLDGYAVAHPEIGVFRREGEASVSIRAVK